MDTNLKNLLVQGGEQGVISESAVAVSWGSGNEQKRGCAIAAIEDIRYKNDSFKKNTYFYLASLGKDFSTTLIVYGQAV